MGHIRLGLLPNTGAWRAVVGSIRAGAIVEEVAEAIVDALGTALRGAARDRGLVETVWLLLQLPHAAKAAEPLAALAEIGLTGGPFHGPISLAAAVGEAIDRRLPNNSGRTDLGEMAQMSAVEAIVGTLTDRVGSLFDSTPDRLLDELGRLDSVARFGVLSRAFFARLIYKVLDYFLSRTLADQVGEGRRFLSLQRLADFSSSLEQYCFGCAAVVVEFSGEWASKTRWEKGAVDREAAARFAGGGIAKVVKALRAGAPSNGD